MLDSRGNLVLFIRVPAVSPDGEEAAEEERRWISFLWEVGYVSYTVVLSLIAESFRFCSVAMDASWTGV